MLPQCRSEAPQTTYSRTAKPHLREKRAVRRSVCVHHRVPSYFPFWNCTGKTEIKTERVWRPLNLKYEKSVLSGGRAFSSSLNISETNWRTLVYHKTASITMNEFTSVYTNSQRVKTLLVKTLNCAIPVV